MSSKTRITKQCVRCKKLFIAQKVTTQFYSHRCASLAYKQRKHNEKAKLINNELSDKLILTISPTLYRDVLLRPRDIANILNISIETVYRYLKSETIKSIKIGQRIYILKNELDVLLNIEKREEMEETKREAHKELITVKEISALWGYRHQKIYSLLHKQNAECISYKGIRHYVREQVESIFSSNQAL